LVNLQSRRLNLRTLRGRDAREFDEMSDTEFARLPLVQRAKRHHERALGLRRLAQSAVGSEHQKSLLKAADQWERLAADVEQRIARRSNWLVD
jgi:hypothetical protein